MIRPRRENARGMNAKTCYMPYYRSKKENNAQEEIVKGRRAEYGKNDNKRLEMEGTGKR